MKYNVSVQGAEDNNRGMNFNFLIEASNVKDALDKAPQELKKVMDSAGLVALSPDPTTPTS